MTGSTCSKETTDAAARRETESVRRRGFFGWLLGSFAGFAALVSTATGLLWAGVTWRFLIPNGTVTARPRFRTVRPSEVPFGTVVEQYAQSRGIWIVHARYRGAEQIFALSTICTHLGCITTWSGARRRFTCPCHGSVFTMDGVPREGPAPRPLERYAIAIADDGRLEVDMSRAFREERGQWSDPASFVVPQPSDAARSV